MDTIYALTNDQILDIHLDDNETSKEIAFYASLTHQDVRVV